MRVTFSLVIVLVLSFLVNGSAAAHQLKTAITTVLFNERTENIEVMHRFYLHDAEHALSQVVEGGADLHASEASQQAFSEYVLEHFAMTDLDEQPLELSTVGYQIDGPHFWVYQETPIPAQLKGLSMRYSALQEVWSDQENMVNIEGKGAIQTLLFTSDDTWLTVYFEDKQP